MEEALRASSGVVFLENLQKRKTVIFYNWLRKRCRRRRLWRHGGAGFAARTSGFLTALSVSCDIRVLLPCQVYLRSRGGQAKVLSSPLLRYAPRSIFTYVIRCPFWHQPTNGKPTFLCVLVRKIDKSSRDLSEKKGGFPFACIWGPNTRSKLHIEIRLIERGIAVMPLVLIATPAQLQLSIRW